MIPLMSFVPNNIMEVIIYSTNIGNYCKTLLIRIYQQSNPKSINQKLCIEMYCLQNEAAVVDCSPMLLLDVIMKL